MCGDRDTILCNGKQRVASFDSRAMPSLVRTLTSAATNASVTVISELSVASRGRLSRSSQATHNVMYTTKIVSAI